MRLSHKTIRPVARQVTIHFEGRPVPALEGETVAAALSAAGIVAFRHTPTGAPRGLFCGMGACFDCVVTVDGQIGRRACLEKVADGMAVTGAMPAEPAPLAPDPQGDEAETRACDVLVVGAGPAGLSAAIAACEAGASVVVLDERDAPGGQYHKPLAASHADPAPDAQFAEGQALRRRAEEAGVAITTGATVWGAFGAQDVAAVVAGAAVTFQPRRLILAPGAHERPVPVPGWTLPGVMTTGALQTLARAQRVSPGHRVLIAGNGPLNLQLACELLAGGVRVEAVVEAAPRPGFATMRHALTMLRKSPGLARQGLSYLATLRRAGVPILWGSRIAALDGEGRVETARIATPAGERVIAAEVVALNLGFQPETGLARALDIPHCFVDTGLGHLATEADADGRTALDGVFAVGDGASLGGSRVALARGRLAGLAVARDLGLTAPDDPAARAALADAQAFQDALWALFRPPPPEALADDTIVCRCEEVTAGRLRQEITGGLVSVAALKKATRAGMGRCQGRFCAASVARLCPHAPSADAFAAPRVPVKPVPAAALMFEAPEFEAPLLISPTPNMRRVPVPDLPAETRRADILVIGGGAVGLSTAYFLARDGADVLVADRDEAGFAASTANAGSLHAQLLSYDFGYPGMPEDGGPAAYSLPLGPRSIDLWKQIAAAAGETLGLSTEGGLMLADSEAGMAWLRAKVEMEKRWGTETHLIGANELRRIAPWLSHGMTGAVFCPAEGRIDPLRGTMALSRLAQRHGARLLKGAEVTGIARDGAAWHVLTTKGSVIAGRVVNCAGPWGGRIGAMVGLDLPVTGTVQQVIVTEPAPRMVEHLVALAHRHLSLKQQDSGGLLIGGGWFGSFDPKDGRSRNLRQNIQGNLWVAAKVLPALRGLSIIRSWTGINVAVDRAPILGEAPGLPGFFNAITANGYTLGPITGRLTADTVLHGAAIDPHYRVERFN
ncbi:FAD-dependent oxidoreductase [Limobrevibacterium gyesilva]|uniref:FAD-dependent oxidoreductase n=1 Tax=Limobrevibacterium gyesilva TaxID=2991712 RepID=A0AA42CF05_9PROT|nr:FAD-dependent oxidoreductase [Limobrevibacterium gyesilva]MCW3474226.1 FAD-dependent oxidoreductase [Limobrevibacterium gyesilva]